MKDNVTSKVKFKEVFDLEKLYKDVNLTDGVVYPRGPSGGAPFIFVALNKEYIDSDEELARASKLIDEAWLLVLNAKHRKDNHLQTKLVISKLEFYLGGLKKLYS